MKIFGKTLSEYVSFQKHILILVLIVGLARLFLSIGGVADSTTKWLSISVVSLIGLVTYAIRVHTTGFGSYKQLLPLLFIQSLLAQGIIIAGIIIAIFTGKDNVFSIPEYSGGRDGKNWLHVLGHLGVGLILGSLIAWLIGSLILLIVKKVAPQGSGKRASA